MQIPHLPISALPAWSKLNDVNFLDILVEDLGSSKGFGIVTSRALTSKDVFDAPTLLVVPNEFVLSREAVEEWTKVDGHLRELLDRAGGKVCCLLCFRSLGWRMGDRTGMDTQVNEIAQSTRGDIMLFLLMQITIAARHHGMNVGASNPWTEYVRMLPESVPVPTMWNEEEKVMLVGTSLEVSNKFLTFSRPSRTILYLLKELLCTFGFRTKDAGNPGLGRKLISVKDSTF